MAPLAGGGPLWNEARMVVWRNPNRPRAGLREWWARAGDRWYGLSGLSQAAGAVVAVLAFSALGISLRMLLGEGYASLIFVLGVSLAGTMAGPWMALAGAVMAALLFNYFVAVPLYEISFVKSTDYAPPVVFSLCAVVSGLLSGRLRDRSRRLVLSNERLASLLRASQALQEAGEPAQLAALLASVVQETPAGRLALFRFDPAGGFIAVSGEAVPTGWRAALARLQLTGAARANLGTVSAWRLATSEGPIGAMLVEGRGSDDDLFLPALAEIVTMALHRAQLAEGLANARGRARASELQSALLASVSHDLRSPLTAISASASALLAYADAIGPETRAEMLQQIVAEADRLESITGNLLQLNRLRAGGEALRPGLLSAVEMARHVIRQQQRHAGGRELRLLEAGDDLLVRADATLFDIALTNVVQNAIRHSPPGAGILLDCALRGSGCVIRVVDEGPGIAHAEQQRVFEPFVRLAGGEGRGSGLGLAIARGFVDACGGSIAIVSPVRDGRGTAVEIVLPLNRDGA